MIPNSKPNQLVVLLSPLVTTALDALCPSSSTANSSCTSSIPAVKYIQPVVSSTDIIPPSKPLNKPFSFEVNPHPSARNSGSSVASLREVATHATKLLSVAPIMPHRLHYQSCHPLKPSWYHLNTTFPDPHAYCHPKRTTPPISPPPFHRRQPT